MRSRVVLIASVLFAATTLTTLRAEDLSRLKQHQRVADFAVSSLYANGAGRIVGAKFVHIPSSAPVYVIQIETAPQAFMWVDTPSQSNRGLAHSLEHLLIKKGTKGRYLNLLRVMRLSQYGAASFEDYNLYCLTSGTGMSGFKELLDSFFDALFAPDFSDIEAEREFYHLGVTSDSTSKEKRLVEQGTVYNEEEAGDGTLAYYFELNKQQFGDQNPFGFDIGGVPNDMRNVRPAEIRTFHSKYYRLGAGVGSIFVFPAKENVHEFLEEMSADFSKLPKMKPQAIPTRSQKKYPIAPSNDKAIQLFSFPSSSDADRGQVRFGWAPVMTTSQVDVRLLQLFMRTLADGERSLLYKSLVDGKTKTLNSEATSVESEVFLGNSPHLPAASLTLSGIPGNRLTVTAVEHLRQHISSTISQISNYRDNSEQLLAFNRLIMSLAETWERDQRIWAKSAPLFTAEYKTDWKEHLNYLEADPGFVRFLADNGVWKSVAERVSTGHNLWRDLVRDLRLSSVPYATASKPSSQLLADKDEARTRRLEAYEQRLKTRFDSASVQSALQKYEEIESEKTREIEKIDGQIKQPRFTEHPPLTPDDDAQYQQFRLNDVPVIAVLFQDAPTIDIGLSFDLRHIPQKYYRYLPLLPRSFDSLGLRTPDSVRPYSDLLAEKDRTFRQFSMEFDSNAVSKRANFAVRASVTSAEQLEPALRLIREMLKFNDLGLPTAGRLRDLIKQRIADDDDFTVNDTSWLWKTADAFRHQGDPLYSALNSHFAIGHWDRRLEWLLHEPVSREELEQLKLFSQNALSSLNGLAAREASDRLTHREEVGLKSELVRYWQDSIPLFAEEELLAGLRQLSIEVQQDLAKGPNETIREIKELQDLVVSRNALKIDVTLDPNLLANIKPVLSRFIKTIPQVVKEQHESGSAPLQLPVMARIERRAGVVGDDFPWVVGLKDLRNSNGGVVFSSDFPGYQQVDRPTLIKVLASKLGSGTGPNTFFMKTFEAGLAYSTSMGGDPGMQAMTYYADRVPDIAALIVRVRSFAAELPNLSGTLSIDYTVQKALPFQRSMLSFTERGKSLARDIYDYKDPAKVRRFSQSILNLRGDPSLMVELTASAVQSIAPVLLDSRFKESQRAERSIFFLAGPGRLLSDAEKRLAIPKLLRVYPSDFWLE